MIQGVSIYLKTQFLKNSQISASSKNFWIDQSAHSIFDYPKMP